MNTAHNGDKEFNGDNEHSEFSLSDFDLLFGDSDFEDLDHPMHKEKQEEKPADNDRPVKKVVKKKVVRRKKKTQGGTTRTDSKGRTYYVDKKTGIEYEVLPGNSKDALKDFKASKGAGLTLEQMRSHTELVEDFAGVDLKSSAERFLPHLQVPISEKERQEAKRKLELENRRRKLEEENG